MSAAEHFQVEREELERVLASGIFDRSPSLAQVLTYICLKYFEGTADGIKEYNIAVDALGRSPDFDQKKDSIVRVQVHRLRERLAAYYESDGASHDVQIAIPQGRYVPQFVRRSVSQPESVDAIDLAFEHAIEHPVAQTHAAVPRKYWWPAALGAAVVTLIGIFAVGFSHRGDTVASAAPVDAGIVRNTGESIRILAGLDAGTFTDGFGRAWLSDRYFTGGNVVKVGDHFILGTREQRLYQSRRQGMFGYDIPLKPGVYELRLHFAETYFGETNEAGFGGEASRSFGIVVNGKTLIPRLDVTSEVGARAADIKVFRDISPDPDGILHLSFTPVVSVPFLNAIEVTPGIPGKLVPIRIVTQDRPYTDHQGRVWEPDRYAIGGQVIRHNASVSGATDPQLFVGERFGNLKYMIPVPPGKYTLTLYMSERWFGPNLGGNGGAGSRLFDIFCNGVAVAREFDVFKRAGGAERAVVQTFRGLEPNYQGKLEISLVPDKNLAILSALEVVDEGR
jgi:Malectin domain